MTTVSIDHARARVASVFRAHKTAPTIAERVANALVEAQVDGQQGHGLSRVAIYALQAASERVNGHARPALHWPRTALGVVDAANGFAFPALDLAVDGLHARLPQTGVAAIAVRNSNHAGVLGQTVEALAMRGWVAIMVAITPKAMAPWGGAQPLFGTNPIAFAAPDANRPPLVVDLSLSQVARGKIMAAAKTGAPIPEGWALDTSGRVTVDPAAALAGSMVPAGGPKGAALALMVEILAGALAGPALSAEATSFFASDGPPSGVGQFLIGCDPQGAHAAGTGRIADILRAIEAQEGARLPGSTRLKARDQAARTGQMDVPTPIWTEIEALPHD